jgi:NADPH:quinone reductase
MAASINPSDVKNVAGAMKQTTLPRVPGQDYAGVVEAGPAEWLGAAARHRGARVIGVDRCLPHPDARSMPSRRS